MRLTQRFLPLVLSLALLSVGCGGAGDGETSTNAATQNSPVSDPTTVPTPSNLNASLSGNYALISFSTGPGIRAVSSGRVNLDGAGRITSGSYAVYNPANPGAAPTVRTLAPSTYNVALNKDITADISTDDGTHTLINQGRLSSNGVFAGGCWRDSRNNLGQLVLYRTPTNASNASLVGSYRFSLSRSRTPGFATGSINFDGAGRVTGGTVLNSEGLTGTLKPGSYSVAANGVVTGSWPVTIGRSDISVSVEGYLGEDRTLAFTYFDSTGELAAGFSNPGPTGTSTNADFSGDCRFLALRNVPSTALVVGSMSSDGNGLLSSGTFVYTGSPNASLTSGGYRILADGTFDTTRTFIATSNGLTARPTFLTLHADKTVASGVVQDSQGGQFYTLIVR